jgi:tRNA modification GTPase
VADLIDAEVAGQARQALAQLGGALGRRYEDWRERLIDILALIEAAVDFPDEDVPAAVEQRAARPLRGLIDELAEALADSARGRRVREGYRVAVIGAPNAGKSSLLNALLERNAAIVTAVAGTTRDVIEAPLLVGGYRVILADMAGVRQTADVVEAEGVRRARAWAAEADLRLWVMDRAAADAAWTEAADLVAAGDLCVLNKADLALSAEGARAEAWARDLGLEILSLSLIDGDAGAVRALLSRRVARDLAGTDFPAATRVRHERQLAAARDHLARALASLDEPELAAEDVRLAGRALAMVTGRIGVEDILGQVFASFCIGK